MCVCVFLESSTPPKSLHAHLFLHIHTSYASVVAAVPSGWKGVLGMPQDNSRDRDACVRIHKSPSRTWRWDVGQQVNDTHRRSAKRKSTIKKLNRFSLPPRGFTGRVGNNRASTVDVDICRQSRGRGTHTALAKALHAPLPEHPPRQLRK